jgi:ABC-type phosphate transport system auxiliary subunit
MKKKYKVLIEEVMAMSSFSLPSYETFKGGVIYNVKKNRYAKAAMKLNSQIQKIESIMNTTMNMSIRQRYELNKKLESLREKLRKYRENNNFN